MASFLQELVDRKATLIEQTRSIAKDLVDAPAAEKQERYDRAKADLSAVLGQIEDEEERSATEADLAEQRAKLEASARPTTSGPQGPEDRSLAEITEFFTFENARKQFVMKRPERRDAVNITIADTTAKGAYTVAEDFYDQVQMHKVAMNPFYDTQATILRTKNGNDIVIPKTTADPAAPRQPPRTTRPSARSRSRTTGSTGTTWRRSSCSATPAWSTSSACSPRSPAAPSAPRPPTSSRTPTAPTSRRASSP